MFVFVFARIISRERIEYKYELRSIRCFNYGFEPYIFFDYDAISFIHSFKAVCKNDRLSYNLVVLVTLKGKQYISNSRILFMFISIIIQYNNYGLYASK